VDEESCSSLYTEASKISPHAKRTMMEIQQYMQTLGQQARQASRAMARATTGIKNPAV
jgi:hypothetical protein